MLMDGQFAENAVWTYEDPYPAMARSRTACLLPEPGQDPRVDVGDVEGAVRDAILHTDDGAGSSQREHWPPTASIRPGLLRASRRAIETLAKRMPAAGARRDERARLLARIRREFDVVEESVVLSGRALASRASRTRTPCWARSATRCR